MKFISVRSVFNYMIGWSVELIEVICLVPFKEEVVHFTVVEIVWISDCPGPRNTEGAPFFCMNILKLSIIKQTVLD